MREIKEYTEEVFRRSRQRIEKRKRNRRRILLCGIPVLLCLLLVGILPEKSSETEQAYVRLEIGTGGREYAPVTDASEVERMHQLMCDAFGVTQAPADPEELYGEIGGFEEDNNAATEPPAAALGHPEEELLFGVTEENGAAEGYVFTFRTAAGDEERYFLQGNELTDEQTGQRVLLSAQHRSEILCLLGQS